MSTAQLPTASANGHRSVVDVRLRSLFYGTFKAVRDTSLTIQRNTVMAFIGPSGCGKSTVLRCINRMNDLIRGFRFEGEIRFRGKDVYDKNVDPVAVRRHIGMVFQQPNPFAMSIYRNKELFENPREKHTQDYIAGAFS
jgi:phosphate transport system ATP-binding protein